MNPNEKPGNFFARFILFSFHNNNLWIPNRILYYVIFIEIIVKLSIIKLKKILVIIVLILYIV